MSTHIRVAFRTTVLLLLGVISVSPSAGVLAWSNGGWTDSCQSPVYGTHDYLALTAFLWLKQYYQGPAEDWQWLEPNLDYYLLGTEAADNALVPNCIFLEPVDYETFGNTEFHHIYWDYNQIEMCDDAAATWADTSYQQAVAALSGCQFRRAAFYLGLCTHYIADASSFPHLMDDTACYRSVFNFEENPCHANYEDWADSLVKQGGNPFLLNFNPNYILTDAYNAAKEVSRITDRGNWNETDPTRRGNTRDCMWMLDHCSMVSDPFNPDISVDFFLSAADSLNRAANAIASVLPGVYRDAAWSCPTIQLSVNSTVFHGGDPVLMQVEVFSPQVLQRNYLFAVLDIYGSLFWFPNWGPSIDAEERNFYYGNTEIPIISIPALPYPLQSGGPFTIYAALTELFTYNAIDLDSVTFFLE